MTGLSYFALVGAFIFISVLVRFVIAKDVREYSE